MLAEAKLPASFWGHAVNTHTCPEVISYIIIGWRCTLHQVLWSKSLMSLILEYLDVQHMYPSGGRPHSSASSLAILKTYKAWLF